jgi:lipid-A-disaccharide synthase
VGRIKGIRRDIDKMFVILPFEKEFYKKYEYDVQFVGHPLIDAIADRKQVDEYKFREEHQLGELPIIALLPGSRKQEIIKMLFVMLSMVDDFSEYKFVIAGAPSQDFSFYERIIGDRKVSFIDNKTYDLLSVSTAALVTSGTATLETALFKIPQVVCYKAGSISYQIAKRIITLKFISLVNLIMDKEVVTELIQNDFTKTTLKKELTKILEDTHRQKLFLEYFELEKKLGGKGASEKVAKQIISNLR